MDFIAKLIGYIFIILFIIGWLHNEGNSDKTDSTGQSFGQTAPEKEPGPKPFLELQDDIFVPSDDAQTYVFTVKEKRAFKEVVTINNDAPLDIVFFRKAIKITDYVVAASFVSAGKQVGEFLEFLGEKNDAANINFFGDEFSKRAAYHRFESPWVNLEPGTYTIVLDNTGSFTPSRGDAPVHLELYSLKNE